MTSPPCSGAVGHDRHEEVPEPIQASPRQETLEFGSQDLKQEQVTSLAGMDFSALSLLSDEDVLPASPKDITAARPLLEVLQWSLDGEEPSAQQEDTSAASEPEPFPAPLDHAPETAENPGATPIFQETLGQVLTPGRITLLPEGATVVLGDQGWQIETGTLADAIATLGEDSGLMLLSGTPGGWVIPAMEAVGMGALLLGQDPSQARASHTISTLVEIGLTSGTPAQLGEQLAHRWGLALA